MDAYTRKTIDKVKRMYGEYSRFLYETVASLPCEIAEAGAPADDPAHRAAFQTRMPEDGWRAVKEGDTWGGEFAYAWIRSSFTVPEALAGRRLFLRPDHPIADAPDRFDPLRVFGKLVPETLHVNGQGVVVDIVFVGVVDLLQKL